MKEAPVRKKYQTPFVPEKYQLAAYNYLFWRRNLILNFSDFNIFRVAGLFEGP